MPGERRTDLVRAGVERGEHGVGTAIALVAPRAVGQEDEGAEDGGGDPRPQVGGLLVQHINWESCFYVNIPVGVIALVIGLLVLRETPPSPAAKSFDIPGIGLLSAFLFLLVWALIKGSGYGWGSGKTIGFFAASAVALALFILREARAKEPLLPLKLFRSVSLSAGTVLVVTLMFSLFGAMFFMTFFMENVHGLDPVATGVRLLPLSGMMIVGAPLAGQVITKIGPRVPMVAGMAMAAAALFGLSRMGLDSGLNDTIAWFALLGLGLSPVMVGGTEVIVGNAPVELAGVAGGLQSTAMQVGGTIGTAVLGGVMAAKVNSQLLAKWTAARLPALSPDQLAGVKNATEVGVAPVQKGIPAQLATAITDVTHTVFLNGMTESFLVAFGVAIFGAPAPGPPALPPRVPECANRLALASPNAHSGTLKRGPECAFGHPEIDQPLASGPALAIVTRSRHRLSRTIAAL